MVSWLLAPLAFISAAKSPLQTTSDWANELQLKLGSPIVLQRELRDELLYVEPRSAEPKRVLQMIATALHASLLARGKGYAIERTKADKQRVHETLIAERSQWLADRLELDSERRSAESKKGPLSEVIAANLLASARNMDDLRSGKAKVVSDFNGAESLPETALLESIVARIPAGELAALASGDAAIYEDNPPAGEKNLPEYGDLLDAYRTSVSRLDRNAVSPQSIAELHESGKDVLLKNWGSNSAARHVRVSEFSNWNGMQFLIEIFDEKGFKVAGSGFFAGKINPNSTGVMLRTSAADKLTRWVPVSPQGVEAMAFARTGDISEGPPLWFLRPTVQEPLSLFVGDSLEAMSLENPDKPTAIVVSDRLWGEVLQSRVGGRINLDAFERILRDSLCYEKVEKGGFVVWSPHDPELAENGRADRKVLQQFALSHASGERLSFRELATFYAQASDDVAPLAMVWAMKIGSAQGNGGMQFDRGAALLRVLGGIPDDEWDALVQSNSSSIGSLGITKEIDDYLRKDITIRTEGRPLPDLYTHPTEVLNNGPLPGARVSIVRSNEKVIAASSDGSDSSRHWRDMDTFEHRYPSGASMSSRLNDSGQVEILTSRSEFDSASHQIYSLGAREDMTIKIQLVGDLYISAHVQGDVQVESEDLAYSDLPAEMRDRTWSNACRQLIKSQTPRVHPLQSEVLPKIGTSSPQPCGESRTNWVAELRLFMGDGMMAVVRSTL